MFLPGLVSVTYRALKPAEIITLAKDAGLRALEWGSDIHVPEGDNATATAVGGMTRGASLHVLSYGTYYHAGAYGENYADVFRTYLDTAYAMGTFSLRLWAGQKNAEDVSAEERAALVKELRDCAKLADSVGRRITFEYHRGTLTSSAASAASLIEEIGMENVSLYWQPNQFVSFEENIENLNTVLPYVSNVHVFAWKGAEKFLLAEHETYWKTYLSILAKNRKRHGLLLEFVPGDKPELLQSEAATLLDWIKKG